MYNKDVRKNPLVNENYYHVLNRSIAKFQIFNDEQDYCRFIEIVNLYRFPAFSYSYSAFLSLSPYAQKAFLLQMDKSNPIIDIVTFSVMPTHFHLFLKQNTDPGISRYISRVLNAYTRYFNTKYHRKGPLWEGRFKSVLVSNDEQALHLTRYIHINAVSAGLVEKPEHWTYSSYLEYINERADGICNFQGLFDFTPKSYKKFVNDRIGYQRNLSKIKKILLEDYAG